MRSSFVGLGLGEVGHGDAGGAWTPHSAMSSRVTSPRDGARSGLVPAVLESSRPCAGRQAPSPRRASGRRARKSWPRWPPPRRSARTSASFSSSLACSSCRHASMLRMRTRGAGLVEQVDGLVGQEAVRGCSGPRAHGRLACASSVIAARGGAPRSGRAGPRGCRSVCSTRGLARPVMGWKRRSRAASFSMYLRYSSMVVAPITWISPRDSGGLEDVRRRRCEPSAAPAPTSVCISSMNRMMSPVVP